MEYLLYVESMYASRPKGIKLFNMLYIPSSFSDDHLSRTLMKLPPQVPAMKNNLCTIGRYRFRSIGKYCHNCPRFWNCDTLANICIVCVRVHVNGKLITTVSVCVCVRVCIYVIVRYRVQGLYGFVKILRDHWMSVSRV